MKLFLNLLLGLSATQAFGWSESCEVRQQNAAVYELAQELGVSVSDIILTKFSRGMWTEGLMMNEGSSEISVGFITRTKENTSTPVQMIQRTYEISARQIMDTPDCKVIRVSTLGGGSEH